MMYFAAVFVLGELLGMPETVFYMRAAAAFLFAAMTVYFSLSALGSGESFNSGEIIILPLFLFLLGIFLSSSSYRAFERDEAVCEALYESGTKPYIEGSISKVEKKSDYRLIELKNVRLFSSSDGVKKREEVGKLSKRIYIYDYDNASGGSGMSEELYPGMRIGFRGSLEAFDGTSNPGEFDYRLYLRSLNVSLNAKADKIDITENTPSPYFKALQVLREKCADVFDKIMTEKDAGIYKALILGDKSDMDEEINDLYQTQGIAHILAVSGLHISLIGSVFYNLVLKAGAGLFTAGATASFFVISYGIFTGASGSAMRSVIMLVTRFFAARESKSYDNLSALAFSAIILLISSPYLLLQSGFQLSYTAIFAISLFGDTIITGIEDGMRADYVEDRLRRYKEHGEDENARFGSDARRHMRSLRIKLRKDALSSCRLSPLKKNIMMGILIQIFTLPVVLYHFFAFPLYAFFLNLVVIPLMAYVMYSGIAGLFMGFLLPPAATLFIGSGHYLLAFYELLCRFAASLPVNSIVAGRPGIFPIIIYYCMIFGITGVFIKESMLQSCIKKYFSQIFSSLSFYNISQKRLAALLFIFLIMSSYVFHKTGPHMLEITAIDVGQGDGFLIRYKDTNILIDGGSSSEKKLGEYTLEPFLLSKGIRDIDFAIVSHGDKDHISGQEYLMEESDKIRIKRLILPKAAENNDDIYGEMKELAKAEGAELSYMDEGAVLSVSDSIKISCIYEGNITSDETNAHSAFLLLEYRDFSMLFTGDAPKEEEMRLVKRMRDEGIDKMSLTVLKAGHHGSATSTCAKLLSFVKPEYAILSYGEGNSYGHPSPEVTERLSEEGVKLLEPAKSGAIRLTTDGRRLITDTYY